MTRPTRFASLRRELADVLTPEPVCDCGKVVPVKDWRVHRASCPMVERRPATPKRYVPDPRD